MTAAERHAWAGLRHAWARRDSNAPVETALITFLSDYGHDGRVRRRLPRRDRAAAARSARVIDITHDDPPPRRARRRARAARRAAVHARGRAPRGRRSRRRRRRRHARRAVALRTAEEGRMLVGPDNGLLMLAAERLGGVVEAVDIGAVAGAPGAGLARRSTAATSSPPSPPRSPPASRSRPSASRWRRRQLRRLELPLAHTRATARSPPTSCAPTTSAT